MSYAKRRLGLRKLACAFGCVACYAPSALPITPKRKSTAPAEQATAIRAKFLLSLGRTASCAAKGGSKLPHSTTEHPRYRHTPLCGQGFPGFAPNRIRDGDRRSPLQQRETERRSRKTNRKIANKEERTPKDNSPAPSLRGRGFPAPRAPPKHTTHVGDFQPLESETHGFSKPWKKSARSFPMIGKPAIPVSNAWKTDDGVG